MTENNQKKSFAQKPIQLFALTFTFTLVTILAIAGLLSLVSGDKEADETESLPIQTVSQANGIVPIDPPQALPDFTMPSNEGDPLNFSDLQGKYVLLAFGYTHCPDVCPATLLNFRRIKQQLGDEGSNLTFLFVSVDGARDTPEVLDRYLNGYDPDFIGMSGTDETLDPIKDDFSLFYATRENPNTQAGYLVEHTASKYLVNPEGELIRIYSYSTETDLIIADLRDLLS